MAYSLWLEPGHRQSQRLKRKIEQLSRQCGSECFNSHVTICSDIKSKPETSTLQALASRHLKPTLAALRTQHSSKYFQCLSLALRRDKALLTLRADALRCIGGNSAAPYRPHISLVYANLNAVRRAAIAKNTSAALLSRCQGSKLQLVLTDGPTSQWQVLEQHDLREQQ